MDALYDQPEAIKHSVQLSLLLNRVIIHPQADESRLPEVEQQLLNAGVKKCAVAKSSLSAKPIRGY
jgi:hypothetical protein